LNRLDLSDKTRFDRNMAEQRYAYLKGLVLGLSASSKSLCNVLKCKTSEKEKFHDIA